MKATSLLAAATTLAALLGGCLADAGDDTVSTASGEQIAGRAGAVFVMSNDATANTVIAYRRAQDGTLQPAATYSTTGRGAGAGLGSQGALTLSTDGKYLFAVNAGSNELSVFRVRGEALYLVDAIQTGGVMPVSVTEHAGLVYVVHAGADASSITGFTQRSNGKLVALAGSTRELSAAAVGPAQVQFSPSGRALLVTEKGTDSIDEFRISASTGKPTSLVVHASSGQTPFGFSITERGQVIVSEAFGGAAGASSVSSYQLGNSSGLATVSASVPDTESAACWIQLARHGRLAFTTNTASGSIPAYSVSYYGELALLDARAAELGDGTKPTDMAISAGDQYLYVLDSGTHDLAIQRVGNSGTLTALGTITGLPEFAAGVAAQ